MRDGRPQVLLKLAISADGKAGLAGRKPVGITGEAARARVHLMRAEADAILVGIGTVLSDDPHLTCRLPGMLERSPVRVVLDARLRMPLASRVIATARETPTWVFARAGGVRRWPRRSCAPRASRCCASPRQDGRLDLAQVLKALAERGITRLMVEGGPTVAAAFVQADLVDEAALFRSPKPLGADGIDALEGLPLDRADASRLKSVALGGGRRRYARTVRADAKMFTGITTDVGEVIAVRQQAEGLRRLSIACGYPRASIALGASIACSGVCLTVVETGEAGRPHRFSVDAAAETLRMTTAGRGGPARGSISSARSRSATSSAAISSPATPTASPS